MTVSIVKTELRAAASKWYLAYTCLEQRCLHHLVDQGTSQSNQPSVAVLASGEKQQSLSGHCNPLCRSILDSCPRLGWDGIQAFQAQVGRTVSIPFKPQGSLCPVCCRALTECSSFSSFGARFKLVEPPLPQIFPFCIQGCEWEKPQAQNDVAYAKAYDRIVISTFTRNAILIKQSGIFWSSTNKVICHLSPLLPS